MRTKEEQKQIVKEWKDSGLTAQEFVKGKDFSASTMYGWVSKTKTPKRKVSSDGKVSETTRIKNEILRKRKEIEELERKLLDSILG